jgi:hypothetical protein
MDLVNAENVTPMRGRHRSARAPDSGSSTGGQHRTP